MKTKKILLLAMAVLCATALAAPAAASAEAFWTEEGLFLEENAEIELEGEFGFETEAGGLNCEVKGTAILEPGESGTLTAFTIDAESCIGTEELALCKGTAAKAMGLPMTIHADTTTAIQLTNVFFVYKVEGEVCPVEDVSINSPEEVFGIPPNAEEIESLSMAGTVTTSLGGKKGEVEGELEVNPAGTYGIWSEF